VTRLRDRGWIDGRNLKIEYRWAAGQTTKFQEFAAELVAAGADVIVTSGDAPAKAARQVTNSIPIVMASSANILASGLVKSLAHPGGNVTGLTFSTSDTVGKRLELLKKLFLGSTVSQFFLIPTPIRKKSRRRAKWLPHSILFWISLSFALQVILTELLRILNAPKSARCGFALRSHRQWPCHRCAAEERDEFAPLHVLPSIRGLHPITLGWGNAALCDTANLAVNV
jgi:hypothetical protein